MNQWMYEIYQSAKIGNAYEVYAYIDEEDPCTDFKDWNEEWSKTLGTHAEDYERGDIEDRELCQRVVKICAWYFILQTKLNF